MCSAIKRPPVVQGSRVVHRRNMMRINDGHCLDTRPPVNVSILPDGGLEVQSRRCGHERAHFGNVVVGLG